MTSNLDGPASSPQVLGFQLCTTSGFMCYWASNSGLSAHWAGTLPKSCFPGAVLKDRVSLCCVGCLQTLDPSALSPTCWEASVTHTQLPRKFLGSIFKTWNIGTGDVAQQADPWTRSPQHCVIWALWYLTVIREHRGKRSLRPALATQGI